jgi:hypothetical protein
MIRSGELAGEEERRRFAAEAAAAARLAHPNAVQVFEVGEHGGSPFLSLELCEGGSLAERLKQKPLTAREAAALAQALAGALEHAHRRGVVHRDVKPGNVLLSGGADGGTWKLADFGLAKRLDAGGGEAKTRTGAFLGTPAYAAPEQARGQNREVGPLADVYSLGAVLYECLTGRPPFNDPDPVETLLQAATAEPVPPRLLQPKVPRDLETVCLKCLEKDPRKRYASAAELADDLGRFLEGRPVLARPVSRAERLWRLCKRNKVVSSLTALAASLVLAGVVGLAVGLVVVSRARDGTVFALGEAQREGKNARAAEREARIAEGKAEAARKRSLRDLYVARSNLAQVAERDGDVERLDALLAEMRPAPGDEDLRGWEWHVLRRQAHGELRSYDLPNPPGLLVPADHAKTKWKREAQVRFSDDGHWFVVTRANEAAPKEATAFDVHDTATGGRVRVVPAKPGMSEADGGRRPLVDLGGGRGAPPAPPASGRRRRRDVDPPARTGPRGGIQGKPGEPEATRPPDKEGGWRLLHRALSALADRPVGPLRHAHRSAARLRHPELAGRA